MLPVGIYDFLQMSFETFVITPFMKRNRNLSCIEVIAAHCSLPFSSFLFGHNFRLPAYFTPFIANGGGV